MNAEESSCPTNPSLCLVGSCTNSFALFHNRNGRSGALQFGLSTQQQCNARCLGDGLQQGATCYGYDFDTLRNECFIFTSDSYQLRSQVANGVDHYKRSCPTGSYELLCRYHVFFSLLNHHQGNPLVFLTVLHMFDVVWTGH